MGTSRNHGAPTRLLTWMGAHSAFAALFSLVAGFAIGVTATALRITPLLKLLSYTEIVGVLWVNSIRMTVIPLVMCSLVSAILNGHHQSYARLTVRAFVFFGLLLVLAGALTVLVAPPVFQRFASSRTSSPRQKNDVEPSRERPQMPSFRSWIADLIPTNPFKAAVDGAILPLLLFSMAFGFAARNIAAPLRESLVVLTTAVTETMVVLIKVVLMGAPVGVFFLSAAVAAEVGFGVLRGIAVYFATCIGLLLVITASLYAVASVLGKIPLRSFARAALPAQVIAASSRSSVSALPVMLSSAEEVLSIPSPIASFVLPLSVATFRLNQAVSWVVMSLFAAQLYGVELGRADVITLALGAILMSFSIPGIPSAGLFVVAPFFAAVGIPESSIGLLIALDAIPDVFKTLTNVTSHMAAVTALSRDARSRTTIEMQPNST